jgi:hypothetical protein
MYQIGKWIIEASMIILWVNSCSYISVSEIWYSKLPTSDAKNMNMNLIRFCVDFFVYQVVLPPLKKYKYYAF